MNPSELLTLMQRAQRVPQSHKPAPSNKARFDESFAKVFGTAPSNAPKTTTERS